MKLKLLVLLAAMGMATNAMAADCKISDPAGYMPEHLLASSAPIRLRADAPKSSDTPIGRANSATNSTDMTVLCAGINGVNGSRPITGPGLQVYPGYTNYYRTNIDGIGVKFILTGPGGDAGVELPAATYVATPGKPTGNATSTLIGKGRLVAYFYKLEDTVKLKSAYQNTVNLMMPTPVAESRIEDFTYAYYKLDKIDIVGIPVCTVDKPLPVDFNTVNAESVKAGVSRSFNFGITCKTDYNDYIAVASITAAQRTPDGKFIKVDDAKNNSDSLIIEITDKTGNKINVDGSTKIESGVKSSGVKADYEWNAILKKQDGTPYPAQGPFKASAIITLDLK